MGKWTPESVITTLLAVSICFVIIVPLFTSEQMSKEGTDAYRQIVIAVVAILSYYLGKRSEK